MTYSASLTSACQRNICSGLIAKTLARRRGQAGHYIFRVLDGQYDAVVPGVGQVDDNPGVVAVAYGEGDALVLMKFRRMPGSSILPLQAVDFGNASSARTPLTALRGNV